MLGQCVPGRRYARMLPSRTSHSGRNGNFCEISRILIGFALGLLRKGAPDIFNKARWSARNGRGINRPLAVTAIGDRLRAWRLTSCQRPYATAFLLSTSVPKHWKRLGSGLTIVPALRWRRWHFRRKHHVPKPSTSWSFPRWPIIGA